MEKEAYTTLNDMKLSISNQFLVYKNDNFM